MSKRLYAFLSSLVPSLMALAQRFPKPDFESGYEYPEIEYPVPNEVLWNVVDIVMLVLLLSVVSWAVIKRITRRPVIYVSLISLGYFGFFREGCVCSIGSIQNVALALTDSSYIVPITVLCFFFLPIFFTLLFGRVFCAGVCPMGALQELVHVRNYSIPRPLASLLAMVPWLYLIFAVLFAVTGTRFIICHFDPFVSIFRLGGESGMILFGAVMVLASMFTGRPFCRFLCPYGAILGFVSRFSIWKTQMTRKGCINCALCHNSCPVDAIRPPYKPQAKESRERGSRRVLTYILVIPVAMVIGALALRQLAPMMASTHQDVQLYEEVMAYEQNPTGEMSIDLEAFYAKGKSVEELTALHQQIQDDFRLYATIAGLFVGLVISLKLLQLSLKRSRTQYGIISSSCVSCGRCFSYCPQNNSKLPASNYAEKRL